VAQSCSSCSSTAPDGAKFCPECGTPFARACPGCGTPAGGGKFCAECGTPLTAGAAPAVPQPPVTTDAPVSERRTTSVLFGDLVSFTTISEARDPEEVRELLSAYFAVARTVVGRYGGTIEKFIGDAVMAVWGVPVAHEDDAERAVRAGLDLVAEVTALGASVGVPDLAMRVGVVTGSVAVTLGAVNEGMVAGDAVNTAARVQSAAAPGTLWTDAETRSLTAAAIAFSDMGEHALKGKAEPVRLFRADAVVAARGGAQRVDGLEAPLTGRDAELRRLKEQFHATEADGRSRLVLVEGQAGTGKSRLGWEFEKYVDGLTTVVRWHRGRCLSYGEGVAFWAFGEMVRSRLGLLEDDDRAAVEAKVAAGVEAVAADAGQAAWLTPRVGALLTGAPGYDRTDLFSAWATYLERVAEGHPLVMLFEDTQHADAGLLDLVEYLLETCGAGLLVVVLARPELRERRPSLVAGPRSQALVLSPLDDDAMTGLVDALVQDLPRRAREALVSRAEGVPLYAVEVVRSLIDRDAVVAREGRYVWVDDGSRVDLAQLAAPTSISTLIAARLDALTPVERRTVQDASVLGLSFRAAGLSALSDVLPYDLDVALLGLVRKGVVEQTHDPRSPELGSYRFLQALVKEVAYSTLARKDRKLRHLAAAEHLSGEDAEGLAGIIAQHLLDALEAMSATDPERPPVAERARGLLVQAAVRAEALGSPEEALHCCLAALGLEPGPDEAADLTARAARTASLAGQVTRAAELGEQALALLNGLGRELDAYRVLAEHGRTLQSQGRFSEALEQLPPALAALDGRADVDEVRLQLLMVIATSCRGTDPDRHVRTSVEALRLAERLGDPAQLVRALNAIAIALVDAGSSTAYQALVDRCIELSREHHLAEQLSRSLNNMLAEVYLLDLRRAADMAVEAIETARRVGEAYNTELALMNAGFVRWLDGDWDALVADARQWCEGREPTVGSAGLRVMAGLVELARGRTVEVVDLPDSDDPYEQGTVGLHRALCLEQSGDVAAAAACAADALRAAYGSGDVLDDFEVFWLPAVELQLRAGAVDEAASLLAMADALTGSRVRALTRAGAAWLRALIALARDEDPEGDLRAAVADFDGFGAVHYAARARVELGRWLLAQGRAAEGAPLLEQARPVLERLRAAPLLVELDVRQPAHVG
jgi:class 3 adenylate cyclase/tetratricopeptide (TPR) repeat protein